jgi:pyruvate,orthophosphate dikinase
MTRALPLATFGDGAAPDPTATPDRVGNKAWGLMHLVAAGLPVPPGFVLGTDACRAFFELGGHLPEGVEQCIDQGVAFLERATGRTFGGARQPLLVSVRSGAAVSMPGMMETLLNVGLTARNLSGLIRATGNPRFAWDAYRRLLQGFAEVVRGAAPDRFERLLAAAQLEADVPSDSELDVAALRALAASYGECYEAHAGEPFPQDAGVQLRAAVAAVFNSWQSPTARTFRRLHGLAEGAGTAVTVQAMVFGNMGGRSGSGVGFTRDPATGEDRLYLDFLFNAQGEDVVSGRHTAHGAEALARHLPDVHAELEGLRGRLERLFGDTQDFEFTVQQGRLFILQTRAAKRTSLAALRIAVDLAEAGIIDPATALERLAGLKLESIEQRRLVPPPGQGPIGHGIPASPGVAVGPIALDSAAAQRLAQTGTAPILVRPDTATSDLEGMAVACGILTAVGSRTSHAAVVARQLDRACIVGCGDLVVDLQHQRCRIGERTLRAGDFLSLDGGLGAVYEGSLPIVGERPTRYLEVVNGWRAEQMTPARA